MEIYKQIYIFTLCLFRNLLSILSFPEWNFLVRSLDYNLFVKFLIHVCVCVTCPPHLITLDMIILIINMKIQIMNSL